MNKNNNSKKTKLIVALDFDTMEQAINLVDSLQGSVEWFKVGKQLFTRYGAATVSELKKRNKKVFLDLKYHDIPNTVAQAIKSAIAIGANMSNVHATGGPTMLTAAATSAKDSDLILTAVTVLTSMNQEQLNAIGIMDSPREQVVRLAKLSQASGVAGVVCSALEIEAIRDVCGKDFILVVPGIRPIGSAKGDQKRVMTPSEAAKAGANYIVVGRPITKAENPKMAAMAILEELNNN